MKLHWLTVSVSKRKKIREKLSRTTEPLKSCKSYQNYNSYLIASYRSRPMNILLTKTAKEQTIINILTGMNGGVNFIN